MKKLTGTGILGFLCIAALALSGCDMSLVSPGNLPVAARQNSTPTQDDIARQVAEMERNGHYLMLYHLPSGVTKDLVKNVAVSDGSTAVALPDRATPILVAPDSVYANVYIPLAAVSGGQFSRTGSFITAFSVHIDALTKITVTSAHNVLVNFVDGKGTLDIEKLIKTNPDIVQAIPDPEAEQNINDITSSGGYIRFFNLPRNVSKNSFSNISVSNAAGIIGRPADYQAIAVRKNVLDAEAFVAANALSGARFSESGSFFVAFSVVADAVTHIIVQPSYASLYEFVEGAASVDVSGAPQAPVKPPVIPHALLITGLPLTTGPANVHDVLIHNSAGPVAKCADYSKVSMLSYNGSRAAAVPLVYDNNRAFNGLDFADSGNFIVSFTVYPDAERVISVSLENYCLVPFTGGNAVVDVSNIPPVPRNCLTITNLPANVQPRDVASVFVWNQAGKVAKCQGYNLLEIVPTGPSTANLIIPLVYDNADTVLFAETGPYFVTFDLNIDALTRLTVNEAEKVLVSFTGGKGVLDAATLTPALPLPYFTLIGLPRNTVRGNISNVLVYNSVGVIAKCADYQGIIITRNDESASAMIPLAYQATNEYFRDTGHFIVTFTVNGDIFFQLTKTREDELVVEFIDGSGEFDLSAEFGFFSGGLVNPGDTAAPVLKSGTVFEMNRRYVKLTANTPVQNAAFPTARVVYVYATLSGSSFWFSYSDTPPVWNESKKGWYLGESRALYKMVYLKDPETRYVAKTYIADDWQAYERYTINDINYTNIDLQAQKVYSLSGSANPARQTYTVTSGWHVMHLAGGGGGGGGGIDGHDSANYVGGHGGAGGAICELVYMPEAAPLAVFTGSGGYASGYIVYGEYQSAGGGGGGSGTYLYSANGYFLCAGGGGGGGGASASGNRIGGGGGAGGSVGSGGGGGAGTGYNDSWYQTGAGAGNSFSGGGNHLSSNGGKGGGYNGGAGGITNSFTGSANPFGNPLTETPITASGAGVYWEPGNALGYTTGTHLGKGAGAGYAEYNNSLLYPWKSTNDANGTGGAGAANGNGANGGAGGNNRNALRGGGGAAGVRGAAVDGTGSAGSAGGSGFVSIYHL